MNRTSPVASALAAIALVILGCDSSPVPEPVVSLDFRQTPLGGDTLTIVATVLNTGTVDAEYPCNWFVPQITVYDRNGEVVRLSPFPPCYSLLTQPCMNIPPWVLKPLEERAYHLTIAGIHWADDCSEALLPAGLYTAVADFWYRGGSQTGPYTHHLEEEIQFQWPPD